VAARLGSTVRAQMKLLLKILVGVFLFVLLLLGGITLFHNLFGPSYTCEIQLVSESISPDKRHRIIQTRKSCTDGRITHSIELEYLERDLLTPLSVKTDFLEENSSEGELIETPKLDFAWLNNEEILVKYPPELMTQSDYSMGDIRLKFERSSNYAP